MELATKRMGTPSGEQTEGLSAVKGKAPLFERIRESAKAALENLRGKAGTAVVVLGMTTVAAGSCTLNTEGMGDDLEDGGSDSTGDVERPDIQEEDNRADEAPLDETEELPEVESEAETGPDADADVEDADIEEAEAETEDVVDEGSEEDVTEAPDSEDTVDVEPEADGFDADEIESEADVSPEEGVADVEAEAETTPDETTMEDGGEEAIEPLCPGVHPDVLLGTFISDTSVPVGGYGIVWQSSSGTGAAFRVTCDADGTIIADGLEIAIGATATVDRAIEDGMSVSIDLIGRNIRGGVVNVNVLDAP